MAVLMLRDIIKRRGLWLKRKSFREPICPEQRLVIALRFLATGANFRDMRFDFFVSEATIRQVCHATCQAIAEVLTPLYVRVPRTEEEWLEIASEFWQPEMVRYTDNYRRWVIREVHVRGWVIWDPTEPQFYSSGARKYAFDGVADRLGHMRTVRDALYGNAAFEDIRRMWRQWVRSFYSYKMRRQARKPKFFAELSFLNELTIEQLHIVSAILVGNLTLTSTSVVAVYNWHGLLNPDWPSDGIFGIGRDFATHRESNTNANNSALERILTAFDGHNTTATIVLNRLSGLRRNRSTLVYDGAKVGLLRH
ncbi:hypothetical protein AAVH_22103 [Aphelenchoides avenae]|nr:hypothetical protein AAVH_22103 [Aphelenchus avenae]